MWKIHFEFPGLATNQPWGPILLELNPIRQLDLTNWQTEHSATFSSHIFFYKNLFFIFQNKKKIEFLQLLIELNKLNIQPLLLLIHKEFLFNFSKTRILTTWQNLYNLQFMIRYSKPIIHILTIKNVNSNLNQLEF